MVLPFLFCRVLEVEVLMNLALVEEVEEVVTQVKNPLELEGEEQLEVG